MPPKHPLPVRPGFAPGASSNSNQNSQQWGYNASGGYPGNFNASGGYAGYSYGYNASGGYAGYANASGGYGGYANTSGGYSGYAAYSYGGYQAPEQPAKRAKPNPTPPAAAPVRSEEEERYLKSKGSGVVAIEGTGIRLETEEDIAAWIAERKKKWPTRERVAEKIQEDDEARARGENPRRKVDAAVAAEEWGREPGHVPSSSVRGGRGRGRGRERGRGRGRGGARGRGGRTVAAEVGGSDSSSTTSSGSDSDSDSDSDDEGPAVPEAVEQPVAEGESDLEPEAEVELNEPEPEAQVKAEPPRKVCQYFLSGKCRNARCKFLHTEGEKKGPPQPRPPRMPQGKKANAFERPSMLGALLAGPINNTLSQLSQSIRFLVANDMLRDVELTPGDAEEAAKKKVEIIDE